MIVSDLSHIGHQVLFTPEMKEGIDFLCRTDLNGLDEGRVEVNGQRIFAIVQRYSTRISEEPKFEYHQRYIDIQYIVSGREVIGWAPADLIETTGTYDMEKDICFGTVKKEDWFPVPLRQGQLMVLYPEDGHAPGLAAATPSSVMKIVVKVRMPIINRQG